jgi:hypothetical protein
MPKRELPPEVAMRIREVVAEHSKTLAAQLEESLTAMFRFYGMETVAAVLEVVDERKGPVAVDELVQILKRGGIVMATSSGSYGGADGDLKRSIAYFTARNLQIKEVNGMVGRVEWPDKRFK